MPSHQWVHLISLLQGAAIFFVEQELAIAQQCTKKFCVLNKRPAESRSKTWPAASKIILKVSKGAKIRNLYNQVPHLTQDTNGKVTN